MTAPERIWACPPDIFDGMGIWHDQQSVPGDTEYIRADLFDAKEAEVALLTSALQYIVQMHELSSIRGSHQDEIAKVARAALTAYQKAKEGKE